ncbi:RNA polymerase sigma-70 factor [Jeongeupia chitinilytica]|uniref:Sigma factor n=1 Tax=Jeongeupia chitinilytica TaxID=1041641 RepID=A0ABQ3H454_9NEIS|nr:RNA polymerase sigma-70 factor [Jeongeupia chitinilytica]GHD68553.1 sigma factor [Jeongeupia chitinilytica]
MNQLLDEFQRHRPRLFGLAYRMLGARHDADDVLQDAWLRWQAGRPDELASAEAWLVTLVTRLSIDRLRQAKLERARYSGPWLPEPVASSEPIEPRSPEDMLEHYNDVSIAFLTLLERLGPDERAAFLLREVFDTDYAEIAAMLDKREDSCRQLVSRARQRIEADRPRFAVSRDAHRALLARFAAAAHSGDLTELAPLFSADAVLVGDGGGKVFSALRPLHGPDRLAMLFHAIARRNGDRCRFVEAEINGEPCLERYVDGVLDTVYCFVTDGAQIREVYVLRNPDKLDGLR